MKLSKKKRIKKLEIEIVDIKKKMESIVGDGIHVGEAYGIFTRRRYISLSAIVLMILEKLNCGIVIKPEEPESITLKPRKK